MHASRRALMSWAALPCCGVGRSMAIAFDVRRRSMHGRTPRQPVGQPVADAGAHVRRVRICETRANALADSPALKVVTSPSQRDQGGVRDSTDRTLLWRVHALSRLRRRRGGRLDGAKKGDARPVANGSVCHNSPTGQARPGLAVQGLAEVRMTSAAFQVCSHAARGGGQDQGADSLWGHLSER